MSLLGERDTAETRVELFADELVDILHHNGKIDDGLIRLLESNYTHMMTFIVRRKDGQAIAVSTFYRFYEALINYAIVLRDMFDDNPLDDDVKGMVVKEISEEDLKKLPFYEALKALYNKIKVDELRPDYILEECTDDQGNYKDWFYLGKVSEEV